MEDGHSESDSGQGHSAADGGAPFGRLRHRKSRGVPRAGTSTGAVTPGAPTITIKDFGYGAPLTVAPGAVVTVTNMDSAGHTVTAEQGQAFDVDVRGSGGTATFTAPSAPGSYPYFCTYHPNMRGTLIVK
ncbi:amicyanin-alpha [Arthrobacter sp. Hiyo4]|nr:amicyanin-alpha [Arthrobacter sp. Hiyo4]